MTLHGEPDAPVVAAFSDEQVADLHYHLAVLLADALPRMAAMGHGHPPTISFEKWQDTLKEMAEGFGDWATATMSGEEQDALPKLHKSLDLMREWFPHLWD